jgi:hypothetical protein
MWPPPWPVQVELRKYLYMVQVVAMQQHYYQQLQHQQ